MTERQYIEDQITRKAVYVQRIEATMGKLDPNGTTYQTLHRSVQSALDAMHEMLQWTYANELGDPRSFEKWARDNALTDFFKSMLQEVAEFNRNQMQTIERRALELERIGRDWKGTGHV